MLTKPQALMDSHVKDSEVVMVFSVFSGNEFREGNFRGKMTKVKE